MIVERNNLLKGWGIIDRTGAMELTKVTPSSRNTKKCTMPSHIKFNVFFLLDFSGSHEGIQNNSQMVKVLHA